MNGRNASANPLTSHERLFGQEHVVSLYVLHLMALKVFMEHIEHINFNQIKKSYCGVSHYT